jgi:hypothetical protein
VSTAGTGGSAEDPVERPSLTPTTVPLRIVLEFDPGEPPSGRLLHDGGRADEFSGRLELYAALERARDRSA